MPCNSSTGEVAVDRKTLNALGYSAVTGQIIPLEINGITKDYEVVGVYEQIYNMGYGNYHYRASDISGNAINAPLLYISVSDGDLNYSENTGILLLNIFISDGLTDARMHNELFNAYNSWTGDTVLGWQSMNRSAVARSILRSSYLGLNRGMEQVNEVLDSSDIEKDFYSGVLVPAFAWLIVLISIFSLYSAQSAVLSKRTERLRLFRCIGMTRKQSAVILSAEFIIISVAAMFIGLLLGCGLYALTLEWQRFFLGISPIYAFRLDGFYAPYVAAITNNPYTFSLAVISICVLVSTVIFVGKIMRLPILNTERIIQKASVRQRETGSAIKLLNRRAERKNRFINVCMLIVVSVVMVSSTFGYLYVREETKDFELLHRLEILDVHDSDSVAEIREQMNRKRVEGFSMFLSMMILFVIIGIAGVVNILSARTKLQQKRIALLRAIGAPKKIISLMLMRQNIKYPLVGGALSAVFLWGFAKLSEYRFVLIERLFESGEYSDLSQNPWYMRFWMNQLYAEDIPLAVFLAVAICGGIIAAAIIPVLISFYKSSIIDEIRSE
jgi:ABC-type antimicrobial peptide transport system permease subunit